MNLAQYFSFSCQSCLYIFGFSWIIWETPKPSHCSDFWIKHIIYSFRPLVFDKAVAGTVGSIAVPISALTSHPALICRALAIVSVTAAICSSGKSEPLNHSITLINPLKSIKTRFSVALSIPLQNSSCFKKKKKKKACFCHISNLAWSYCPCHNR